MHYHIEFVDGQIWVVNAHSVATATVAVVRTMPKPSIVTHVMELPDPKHSPGICQRVERPRCVCRGWTSNTRRMLAYELSKL